jgi:hypothetical protein
MAACVCDMFEIRKPCGFIFHLHLVTECDHVESSEMTVELLKLNYSTLENHTQQGILWSQS